MRRRRAHVAMPQRHDLGTRSRSGGVKHEGNVVGLGGAGRGYLACRLATQGEDPGRAVCRQGQFQQRDRPIARDLSHRRVVALQDQDGFGLEVREVEVELLSPIAGVERSGGRGGGHGEEGGRHLGSVGQHNPDRVSTPDAQRVERIDTLGDQRIQSGKGEVRPLRRADRGRCGILGPHQVENRLRHRFFSGLLPSEADRASLAGNAQVKPASQEGRAA